MPRTDRTLDDVFRIAEEVLGGARVDHVFVGGVAVFAFGMPRATMDVDVIAELEAGKIPLLVTGFRRAGFFTSEADLRDALVDGGHVSIQDERSVYRIDLVPATTEAHREALRTKRKVKWRGRRIPLAAPEQTIVMKLRWGSTQDLEDAMAIYLRQRPDLDLRALRALARRHRVVRELADLESSAKGQARP